MSKRALGEHQFGIEISGMKATPDPAIKYAIKDVTRLLNLFSKAWATQFMDDKDYVPSADDIMTGLAEFVTNEYVEKSTFISDKK